MLPRHRPFSSCEDDEEDVVDADDEDEGDSVEELAVVTIKVLSRECDVFLLFIDSFNDNRFTSSSMADEFVVLKLKDIHYKVYIR